MIKEYNLNTDLDMTMVIDDILHDKYMFSSTDSIVIYIHNEKEKCAYDTRKVLFMIDYLKKIHVEKDINIEINLPNNSKIIINSDINNDIPDFHISDLRSYNDTFDRKGYGAIFIEKETDRCLVEAIIDLLDHDEYIHYFNPKLIKVYDCENIHYNCAEYAGKFEINLNKLQMLCWRFGINIFVVKGKITGFEE